MRRILTLGLLALGLLAAAPSAQGPDEAVLRAKHAEKLKKEFVGKIPWEQGFEQARAKAKGQGKLILGYFTRSYAA